MNSLRIRLLATSLCAVTVLCHCGSSNPAHVQGSVGGTPYTAVNSAISSTVKTSKGESGWIVLSNAVDLCSSFKKSNETRLDQRIEISVYTVDSKKMFHAPTAPGVFNVDATTNGPFAEFVYKTMDQQCQPLSPRVEAASGTVTLENITEGEYQGSFDVKLNTGDHLTGTFGSSSCDANSMDAAYNDDRSLSCQ